MLRIIQHRGHCSVISAVPILRLKCILGLTDGGFPLSWREPGLLSRLIRVTIRNADRMRGNPKVAH
jgi:hypothetical protein